MTLGLSFHHTTHSNNELLDNIPGEASRYVGALTQQGYTQKGMDMKIAGVPKRWQNYKVTFLKDLI